MYRTHNCGELRISNVGQKVTLAGWVQKSRKLGGMTFVDLRDRYGITQLVVDASAAPELIETASSLGREWVLQVTGQVIERVIHALALEDTADRHLHAAAHRLGDRAAIALCARAVGFA